MKYAFLLLALLASAPASAAGLYGCGNAAGDKYGLLFQEKGGAQGFFFVRNGNEPGEAVQIHCSAPSGEKSLQLCSPVLPREQVLVVTMRLSDNGADILNGDEWVSAGCAEIE